MPLRERLAAALESRSPIDELEHLVAQEQARVLRRSAEILRGLGRRHQGSPGDRHRRYMANRCAEVIVARGREISRTADIRRRRLVAHTTDTTQEGR